MAINLQEYFSKLTNHLEKVDFQTENRMKLQNIICPLMKNVDCRKLFSVDECNKQ